MERGFAEGPRWVIIAVKMSLSREERIQNINEALRLLLQDLGTNNILGLFDPTDKIFSGIHNTTWHHLLDRNYLSDHSGFTFRNYRFTAYGYVKALELAGELHKTELKEQLGKLCAAFKSIVDGRSNDQFAYLPTFAPENNLSLDWTLNMVDGNLIEHVLHRRGVKWESRPTTVRIPIDFGLELL